MIAKDVSDGVEGLEKPSLWLSLCLGWGSVRVTKFGTWYLGWGLVRVTKFSTYIFEKD